MGMLTTDQGFHQDKVVNNRTHTAPYGVKNGHMLSRPEMVVKSSKIVSEESYHKQQHILGKKFFF